MVLYNSNDFDYVFQPLLSFPLESSLCSSSCLDLDSFLCIHMQSGCSCAISLLLVAAVAVCTWQLHTGTGSPQHFILFSFLKRCNLQTILHCLKGRKLFYVVLRMCALIYGSACCMFPECDKHHAINSETATCSAVGVWDCSAVRRCPADSRLSPQLSEPSGHQGPAATVAAAACAVRPAPQGVQQEEATSLTRPGPAGAAQHGRGSDPPQPEARPTFCPSPGFIRRGVSASCDCGQVAAGFSLFCSLSGAGRLYSSVGGGEFSAGKVCGAVPQSRLRGRTGPCKHGWRGRAGVRRGGEPGTSLQGAGDRGAGRGQDQHYQALRAPALLSALPGHYRGGFCSQSHQLGQQDPGAAAALGHRRWGMGTEASLRREVYSSSEACCRGFLLPVYAQLRLWGVSSGQFPSGRGVFDFGRLWVPCGPTLELLWLSSKSCSTSGCSQLLLQLSHGSCSAVLPEEMCLLQVGCAQ